MGGYGTDEVKDEKRRIGERKEIEEKEAGELNESGKGKEPLFRVNLGKLVPER